MIIRTDKVEDFFDRRVKLHKKQIVVSHVRSRQPSHSRIPRRCSWFFRKTRRRLMVEVMDEPKTITHLPVKLHRGRSAINKNMGMALRRWSEQLRQKLR